MELAPKPPRDSLAALAGLEGWEPAWTWNFLFTQVKCTGVGSPLWCPPHARKTKLGEAKSVITSSVMLSGRKTWILIESVFSSSWVALPGLECRLLELSADLFRVLNKPRSHTQSVCGTRMPVQGAGVGVHAAVCRAPAPGWRLTLVLCQRADAQLTFALAP